MNYAQYFAIEKNLKQQGFDFERSELVAQFTAGKKSGLSALSYAEYKHFIIWLNEYFGSTNNNNHQKERENLMRRKIIALFHKMGYKLETGKINIERVNQWCITYGRFHKELNDHTYNELTAVLSQVEIVYKSFLNTL